MLWRDPAVAFAYTETASNDAGVTGQANQQEARFRVASDMQKLVTVKGGPRDVQIHDTCAAAVMPLT